MQQIHWPAILKFDQDDELMYLANHQDWLSFICANQYTVCLQDALIDSSGHVYLIEKPLAEHTSIDTNVAQLPNLVKQPQPINILQMLPLVRQFGQFQGHCCSSKIVFTTIEQGIATVAQLEQLY
ncbi:DUF4144 family protein [Shewanella ulleungensis]|uniref:Uncharacterized protein n=1 Tax=Shewanella ulleungensis TaxID=2282699 RepID=A0ABQ2QQ73_9GAMM|nr:DUF4144 family protein [Shewanella ulleungensis]MCL1150563.1 DUF4144 domain-containing protein [Shewanella ulleungensis]GGP92130.1 hypothetical protein GCM10009410_27720 [Shewanella ulleungensis]